MLPNGQGGHPSKNRPRPTVLNLPERKSGIVSIQLEFQLVQEAKRKLYMCYSVINVITAVTLKH